MGYNSNIGDERSRLVYILFLKCLILDVYHHIHSKTFCFVARSVQFNCQFVDSTAKVQFNGEGSIYNQLHPEMIID